jgi:hypothetical protein
MEEKRGHISNPHLIRMLLVLIPIAWIALVALVVAACQASARADVGLLASVAAGDYSSDGSPGWESQSQAVRASASNAECARVDGPRAGDPLGAGGGSIRRGGGRPVARRLPKARAVRERGARSATRS